MRPLAALVSVDPSKPPIRFPDDSGRTLAEVVATSPDGSVIELAPGRYEGPLVITRALALRGAGDLTRITSAGPGSVLIVDGPPEGWVEVASVLVEGGTAAHGAGVGVRGGRVRLFNVHVRHCEATGGGGALAVEHGDVHATKLRAHDVKADEGGAVWVGSTARLLLADSQLEETEAKRGGSICLKGRCEVTLRGVTIRKSRAVSSSGGQAFYLAQTDEGTPDVTLERVRLEDAPLGLPLVVESKTPPRVEVRGCDMPRIILDTPGVVDGGDNDWR